MVTISLQLPDELARQVLPLQDHLPEIIQVGLQHWGGRVPAHRNGSANSV